MRAIVTVGLVAVGIAAAAALLQARDRLAPLPAARERLLHLRSGSTANRLFLTFDALAADVYWMRAIQHYGRDRRSLRGDDKFELLEPLLDLTTSLDPHFNIAYRFGAIFLSMDPPNGPGRTDRAIALLEKGLAANPQRWQYAHDIAYVNYWHTGDYAQAARWFARAAAIPGAPDWIQPLAAITLAQGGDRSGARQILTELVSSSESYIQAAAARALAQLDALDQVDRLNGIVDGYRRITGRAPGSWADLVGARLLPGVPLDSTGTPFSYDPATGIVTLSAESALAPLPRGLGPT
jgi:tetratricopeptide (TPR) repeat protein